uniref:Uncharacterized protein n=1 Tax=Tanacetum cinerariifolium TaxID=118510 RepID=A0A6L2JCR4_TANCI|nr:hypothetical protein [Tanacetum cinerariifolium]
MSCDDVYRVTPRVSAVVGYDRLVSDPLVIERFCWEIVYPLHRPQWFICPKTGHRMKRTAYSRCVLVITPLVHVKGKSPKKVPNVKSEEELEEDPKEDPQEDSKEEGEPNKRRLKEASDSDSNTWPLDDSTRNEETN